MRACASACLQCSHRLQQTTQQTGRTEPRAARQAVTASSRVGSSCPASTASLWSWTGSSSQVGVATNQAGKRRAAMRRGANVVTQASSPLCRADPHRGALCRALPAWRAQAAYQGGCQPAGCPRLATPCPGMSRIRFDLATAMHPRLQLIHAWAPLPHLLRPADVTRVLCALPEAHSAFSVRCGSHRSRRRRVDHLCRGAAAPA